MMVSAIVGGTLISLKFGVSSLFSQIVTFTVTLKKPSSSTTFSFPFLVFQEGFYSNPSLARSLPFGVPFQIYLIMDHHNLEKAAERQVVGIKDTDSVAKEEHNLMSFLMSELEQDFDAVDCFFLNNYKYSSSHELKRLYYIDAADRVVKEDSSQGQEKDSIKDSLEESSSFSSEELCLPDEESLIKFDDLFFTRPEIVEHSDFIDCSESESYESESFESDPDPYIDDMVHHGGFYLSMMYAPRQSYTTYMQFCSTSHLNQKTARNQKDFVSFQESSIDPAIHSFPPYSYPFIEFHRPFSLSHDDEVMTRFDDEVIESMFQQTEHSSSQLSQMQNFLEELYREYWYEE